MESGIGRKAYMEKLLGPALAPSPIEISLCLLSRLSTN